MRGEVIAMDGYILRNRQEQLALPADAADKLLQSGQGDAALLYLALRRFGRGVTPEELEKVLPISRLRIDAAEKVLQDLDLLPRPVRQTPPDPADERPVYTAQDIAGLLTDNEGFRLLVPQTEQQLGKKLRTADLQILAGLYDDLGMPADVIYLLVCHCVERARSQWGEGRRPTMRQVEKEGYRGAQLGSRGLAHTVERGKLGRLEVIDIGYAADHTGSEQRAHDGGSHAVYAHAVA